MKLLSVALLERLREVARANGPVDPRRFPMTFGVEGSRRTRKDGWIYREVRFGRALLCVAGSVGRCAPNLPLTILRPTAFMELMTDRSFYPAVGTWRIWPTLTGEHRAIAWLALEDLGAIAAIAFSAVTNRWDAN